MDNFLEDVVRPIASCLIVLSMIIGFLALCTVVVLASVVALEQLL